MKKKKEEICHVRCTDRQPDRREEIAPENMKKEVKPLVCLCFIALIGSSWGLAV